MPPEMVLNQCDTTVIDKEVLEKDWIFFDEPYMIGKFEVVARRKDDPNILMTSGAVSSIKIEGVLSFDE